MKVRRFEGATVREALQRIRKEWGTEALILKTQRIRRGFAVSAALPSRLDREREVEIDWTPARCLADDSAVRPFERAGLRPRLVADLRRGAAGAMRAGETLEAAMRSELAARIPIYPRRGVLPDAGPRVLAFVGPTGVGKTTTLAKLAGRLVHEAGVRPALVTLDTYRVAAVDQLGAYARLLKAPFAVASSPEELTSRIAGFAERKVVLVDTTGRSPFDAAHLRELHHALVGRGGLESLLCLSATTSAELLDETVERFRMVRPRACVFTKIDEATQLGGLVSTAIDSRLPVAYLADGQEVPRDLHPALGAAIVRRMFHGAGMQEVGA